MTQSVHNTKGFTPYQTTLLPNPDIPIKIFILLLLFCVSWQESHNFLTFWPRTKPTSHQTQTPKVKFRWKISSNQPSSSLAFPDKKATIFPLGSNPPDPSVEGSRELQEGDYSQSWGRPPTLTVCVRYEARCPSWNKRRPSWNKRGGHKKCSWPLHCTTIIQTLCVRYKARCTSNTETLSWSIISGHPWNRWTLYHVSP